MLRRVALSNARRRTQTHPDPCPSLWRASAAGTDATAWSDTHRLLKDRARYDVGYRPSALDAFTDGPLTDSLVVLMGPRRVGESATLLDEVRAIFKWTSALKTVQGSSERAEQPAPLVLELENPGKGRHTTTVKQFVSQSCNLRGNPPSRCAATTFAGVSDGT